MKDADKEVYFGTLPMLSNERVYSFWDIVLVTGAWAIATWTYVQGGTLASMIGFKAAVTQTIFSMILAGVLIYLCVIIATRFGIDVWIYLRAVLGQAGLMVFGMVYIAIQFGYFAINADVYANSISKVIEAGGINYSESWHPWIAATCVIIGMLIAQKGPTAVKISTRIMVPTLLLVGVFIVFTVFKNYSLSELNAIVPPDEGAYGSYLADYMVTLEWNIAYILTWFGVLGVVARLVKTERSSYWGHMTGFSVIMALFICVGVVTSLAMFATTGVASDDPTEWLIELGGTNLGLVSLIFIIIANISTQAVASYSFSVSTRVLLPKLKFKTANRMWAGWIIVLVFWGGIWEYYESFLAIIGSTAGSITALLLTDFYIVRRKKFSLRALYRVEDANYYNYSKGFNIIAWISFAAGLTSYLLVYNPITDEIKSDLFLFTTATGLTMIISSIVYIILNLFKPINKYIRQDFYAEKKKENIS